MVSPEWYIDSSILFRLALAILLGGIVGLEREMRWRPAGLRTHMMVCLGATVLILGSEYTQVALPREGAVFAPDRLAAGIITGIGFLGAGAILKEGNAVRGLTTAGSIWLVAGLGIVIGKQQYSIAISATVAAMMILVLFRYLEHWIPALDPQDILVRLDYSSWPESRKKLVDVFDRFGSGVERKKITVDPSGNEVEIRYVFKMAREVDENEVILNITQVPGVKKVIW